MAIAADQPVDIRRRSASRKTCPPLGVESAPARQLTEVAKLIDVSKCIGCKACQVGLPGVERPARGGRRQPTAVYDNPHDLTPATGR